MATNRPRTPPMLERSDLSNYNMLGDTLPVSKTSDETFSRFYGIFYDLIDSVVAINRNKKILEECQRKLYLLTLVITEKPDAEVKACLLNRLGIELPDADPAKSGRALIINILTGRFLVRHVFY